MRSSPEFELIERIRDALSSVGVEPGGSLVGIGDDAAVTPAPEGVLVTTVDLFVENVHFSERFSDEQIGHKAMAATLSDLAAMGAAPREAYVSLVMPPALDPEQAVAIARGLGRVAARHGVRVLGGDISRGGELVLAATAVGSAPSAEALVMRSGARPGDVVLVSGALGGAAAGFALLAEDRLAHGLPAAVADALVARQLTPEPQIDLGVELARCGASAMIDISDGVVADAEQIATESGVALELRAGDLPLGEGVAEVAAAAGQDPLFFAGAGEDYELLVTLAPTNLDTAMSASASVGARLTEIGAVERGSGVRIAGGEALSHGFDHLGAG